MRSPLLQLAQRFAPRRGLLGAAVLALLAAAALGVVGPWLVAQAIDVDLVAGDRAGLIRRCGLYLITVVGAGLFTWAGRVALEVAASDLLLDAKRALFRHLAEHDLQLHDRLSSGSLVGRLQGDIAAVRVLLVEVLFALPVDALAVLGMVAVLFASAPVVAAPVVAVLPVYVALLWLFRRVAAPRYLANRVAVSTLTGVLAELVSTLPAMRVLGRHEWSGDRARGAILDARRTEIFARLQSVWFLNTALLIRTVGMVAVLVWGAAVVQRGDATVGALVMGLAYMRQLFTPLMRLSHQLSTLEQARAASVRLVALFNEPRTLVDPAAPTPWPGLKDELRLEGVSFHYAPNAPVLSGVDLRIPAGSRVGLVGATGAGKSTLVDLMLRFRDPVSGRVSVDGVDLRDVERDALRSRTGLVLQDVRLLPGTVLDNLGGEAVAAQRALDRLGLTLPLDAEVDGRRMSRGERQLLTLARALTLDPDLLVLDEATSAVDPATEVRMQRAIDALLDGRTAVIVAHRLQTIRTCDPIVVLHRGSVCEVGTHGELLARGGLYAALVKLQAAA